MDSNNFLSNAGVGEREARIICPFVSQRYYGLGHGIGRSGDISAEQPKLLEPPDFQNWLVLLLKFLQEAAGSSLLAKLATFLAKNALQEAGLSEVGNVQIVPLATGMTLTMVLLGAQAQRKCARYVIWSRIDQKTCFKCVQAANLIPVVVELKECGDQLDTNCQAIEDQIKQLKPENIVAVLSTTSCFAPRGSDKVVDLARLCQQYGVPHIINNAYGVQSKYLCNQVSRSMRVGRVDCVIQSTDKNFMVPVGGCVIFDQIQQSQKNQKLLQQQQQPQQQQNEQGQLQDKTSQDQKQLHANNKTQEQQKTELSSKPQQLQSLVLFVAKQYPGRASVNTHLDLMVTLLHLGKKGWLNLLEEREQNYQILKSKMKTLAQELGERVLETEGNPISIAFSLNGLEEALIEKERRKVNEENESSKNQNEQNDTTLINIRDSKKVQSQLTMFGSILWQRQVSGTRVVGRNKIQKIGDQDFKNYGAHCNYYPYPYLTAAAALGMQDKDVDLFIQRLKDNYIEFKEKIQNQ